MYSDLTLAPLGLSIFDNVFRVMSVSAATS